MVKLGELVKQNTNTEAVDPDKLYRLLGVRLEGKGPFIREEKLGSQIRAKKLQRVNSGDFIYSRLFAWRGAFGAVHVDMDGAYVSNEFPNFKINEKKVELNFLELYFRQRWVWKDIEKNCTGTTKASRNRFKEKFFLDFEILLPPLDEQRRIVAKIEGLMKSIEEVRRLWVEAVKESEGLLSKVSGEIYNDLSTKWGTVRLVDISEQITDGTHKTPTYMLNGVPFLSVKDITSGKISFSNVKYISEAEHKELIKRCKPEKGNILLTKVGTTGYAKVIDVDREFSVFVSLCLIKLKKDIVLPEYVEHMLNSNSMRKLSEEYTRGIGNKNLVLKFINEFPIPLPPLPIQYHIVACLDSLQDKIVKLKKLQDETEKEIEELIPSVLDKAFKGEL